MQESIGMLSAAYFASRSQILAWVNALLGVQYTKIEQTASGVAACQIFDALFPEKVKLEKVNFGARRDYEFIQNYKVLQAAFNRVGIQKQVDVERLVKAKYQDNLEFMQWVKGFFDSHASDAALSYDGAARRAAVMRAKPGARAGRSPIAPRARASAPRAAAPRASPPAARPGGPPVRRAASGGAGARARAPPPPREERGPPRVLKSELDAAQAQLAELTTTLEEIDGEREFYFNKLRGVEIIVQGVEDTTPGEELDPAMAQIKAILYETEDIEEPVDGEPAEEEYVEEGDAPAAAAGEEPEGGEEHAEGMAAPLAPEPTPVM